MPELPSNLNAAFPTFEPGIVIDALGKPAAPEALAENHGLDPDTGRFCAGTRACPGRSLTIWVGTSRTHFDKYFIAPEAQGYPRILSLQVHDNPGLVLQP